MLYRSLQIQFCFSLSARQFSRKCEPNYALESYGRGVDVILSYVSILYAECKNQAYVSRSFVYVFGFQIEYVGRICSAVADMFMNKSFSAHVYMYVCMYACMYACIYIYIYIYK